MRLNLHAIQSFVAVYEERSFTAAATRINATQPGVSQHIGQLEAFLGVLLFDRARGGVDPTPAGHAYYGRCVAILNLNAEAIREARQFRSDLEGEIRVGISPVLFQAALAPALVTFTTAHPNVAVRLFEGSPEHLLTMVLAERLDFAVTPTGPYRAGVRGRVFITTPEILISRRTDNLAQRGAVRLAEIGPLQLVLPGSHYIRRQAFNAYVAAVGAEITGLIEMDSVSGSLAFVLEADNWATVLPSLTIIHEFAGDRFAIRKIEGPELLTEFSLIEPGRLRLSPAAQAFSDLLHESSLTLARDCNRRLETYAAQRAEKRRA